jgi:hypothetical protein
VSLCESSTGEILVGSCILYGGSVGVLLALGKGFHHAFLPLPHEALVGRVPKSGHSVAMAAAICTLLRSDFGKVCCDFVSLKSLKKGLCFIKPCPIDCQIASNIEARLALRKMGLDRSLI